MKYIKKFENLDVIKEVDNVSIDKPFFILDTNNKLPEKSVVSICKILKIEDDFINWEEYDYDDFEKAYQVLNRALHIKDFNKYYKVVEKFKTFKEMKKYFEMMSDSNKYNL
jgi:hypothetical protein